MPDLYFADEVFNKKTAEPFSAAIFFDCSEHNQTNSADAKSRAAD